MRRTLAKKILQGPSSICSAFICAFLATSARAQEATNEPVLVGRVRMRAREHYEFATLNGPNGARGNYRGFTNTINLWYEVPFRWSLGLAGSPLFATLRNSTPPLGFGSVARLVHVGVEFKYFPGPALASLFCRVGTYAATLNTGGPLGTLHGPSELFGVGYEFVLGKAGLAPELSWRAAQFSSSVFVRTFAPAVGLHFYSAI